MKIKEVNIETCIRCRECIKECPPKLFSQADTPQKTVIFQDPGQRCIRCGHCIAVCKPGAILHEAEEPAFTFENIQTPEKIASYDTVLNFLALRRSVRRYKQKAVAPEDLKAVFKAMQYAASASNARSWQYIVITNPEQRTYLSSKTIGLFKALRQLISLRWLVRPFLPKFLKKIIANPDIKSSIDKTLADFKNGVDMILFHAPCVLILHAPVMGSMGGNDAGIALTYGMLAAQSRGLATCWAGFAQEAINRQPALQRWLSLPKGHKVFGVLTLGYPDVQYHFVPPRSEVPVRYM